MVLILRAHFISVCVSSCSKVQEHGAWRVVSALPALLSSGSGESTEGRLAEEAAEYHEKLAAALVCPADWSSVFLQGPGWNQGTGDVYKITHLIYTYTRQVPDVTCCPRRLHCCMSKPDTYSSFMNLYDQYFPTGPVDPLCVLQIWK